MKSQFMFWFIIICVALNSMCGAIQHYRQPQWITDITSKLQKCISRGVSFRWIVCSILSKNALLHTAFFAQVSTGTAHFGDNYILIISSIINPYRIASIKRPLFLNAPQTLPLDGRLFETQHKINAFNTLFRVIIKCSFSKVLSLIFIVCCQERRLYKNVLDAP